MSIYLLIPICAGLCLFFLAAAAARTMSEMLSRAQVTPLRSDLAGMFGVSQAMLMLRPLAAMAVKPFEEQLQKTLVYAGQPAKLDAVEFAAAVLTAACAAAGLLILVSSFPAGPSAASLFVSVLIGALAAAVVLLFIGAEANDRQRAIERQMPYFLDLAVMATEAGSSLMETMTLFASKQPSHPLSQELNTVLREINLGSTYGDALTSFESRLRSSQMRTIVGAISQGLKLGTPLAQVLRAQGDDVRFIRTRNAEQASEELKVKILGPTMLMMISVFIIIIGPAIVETLSSGLF